MLALLQPAHPSASVTSSWVSPVAENVTLSVPSLDVTPLPAP
ncbi:hypothetical protein [Deinococcus ruber]|nr:hypothetical protein [Deinococcus ruber]